MYASLSLTKCPKYTMFRHGMDLRDHSQESTNVPRDDSQESYKNLFFELFKKYNMSEFRQKKNNKQ